MLQLQLLAKRFSFGFQSSAIIFYYKIVKMLIYQTWAVDELKVGWDGITCKLAHTKCY